MYQFLLTHRYLTSKVMPLLAALAVALCTAMVIIVWSVMGGFLVMLINSGRTLVGDVTVSWPITGFAHYEELIKRLEADPDVAAATPTIETYGLIGLPDGRTETVMIKGVDGPSYTLVTDFADTLYWKPIDTPHPKDVHKDDPRLSNHTLWKFAFEGGKRLVRFEKPERGNVAVEKPGVVLGVSVSGFNIRERWGFYPGQARARQPDGTLKMVPTILPVDGNVTINVLPMDSKGRAVDMVARSFPVANEFHSGLYEIDHKTVFLQLGALQEMLKMNRAQKVSTTSAVTVNERGEESFTAPTVLGEDPARVTNVLVRGKTQSFESAAADRLADKVAAIYRQFAKDFEGQVPPSTSIRILTWEDQNRTMINAVRKETALVLFIFSFVSMTAVFLVLAIFWAMVSEKTKDIGILRAIGASRAGVAGTWLLYGAAIGLLGAVVGFGIAYGVVTNINAIHEWLGEKLGLYIWDPKIYYFSRIPSDLNARHVAIVLAGGVLASCVGALWPALRAARMSPVRALRFE